MNKLNISVINYRNKLYTNNYINNISFENILILYNSNIITNVLIILTVPRGTWKEYIVVYANIITLVN